jgi:hypothetical protein
LAKAGWEDFKCIKNQGAILDGIGSVIISHFTQNWRNNTNSRSSYMTIEQIYIKLKPGDIIRFLIDQLNLIMGHIIVV